MWIWHSNYARNSARSALLHFIKVLTIAAAAPDQSPEVQPAMASTSERQTLLTARGDGVEAALLEGEMVTVQRAPHRTVFLKNNIYTKTNFYIDQSRPYFRAPLTKYINIWWHQWTFLAVFLVSFLTPLDAVFAFIWFIFGIPYFFLYLQHAYVNIFTMIPYVLNQPCVPDNRLEHGNGFFIITYANYSILFGETDDAVLRHVEVEGGKLKVQAFRRSSKHQMKMCVAISTLGLVGSVWMMDWCLAWFIVLVGSYGEDS